MASGDRENWLVELETVLSGLRSAPTAPILDIEWLLQRCEDTRHMAGDLREASLQQLEKDVAQFAVEFPGLLPHGLVPTRSG